MTDSRIQGRMVHLETPPNTAPLGKKTLRDAARRAPDPRQPRYRATGAGERRGHGGGTAALRRARFSGSLHGLKLVPLKWRYLVPPTSG
jgi:hypothetical protein